jgi:hypothetical protein
MRRDNAAASAHPATARGFCFTQRRAAPPKSFLGLNAQKTEAERREDIRRLPPYRS